MKIWTLKDKLVQILAKGSKNLVKIQARNHRSKAYKEWIVLEKIINAQA